MIDKATRFWDRVMPEPNSGCWLWVGTIVESGYGHYWHEGKSVRAHRFAYERAVGSIPDNLVLDHKCRVRSCVNPDHLEPVTVGENIRRGLTGKHQSARTHCPHGHAYDDDNTYYTKNGKRNCRACQRVYANARYKITRSRNRVLVASEAPT